MLACGDRGADLIVGLELVTFYISRTTLVETYCSIESGPYVAFRPCPMGLALVVPLRSSTEAVTAEKHPNLENSAEVSSPPEEGQGCAVYAL